MRGGRPEQRHHGVADELLDGAAVPLQFRAEPLVVRPQDRLDVFRIERLGAGVEAHEVGEQHRDDLPLALHGYRSRSTWYPRLRRDSSSTEQ